MELILSAEIETEIKKRANQQGISPEELVLSELQKLFSPPETKVEESPDTLYDFLQEFVGINKNDHPTEEEINLSQDTGRKFTDILMEKHRSSKR